MRKYAKVVTHEGTGSGTNIFYKHKYGKWYYSTLATGNGEACIIFTRGPNIFNETTTKKIKYNNNYL